MSDILKKTDFDKIHGLWGELAEFSPAKTDLAQLHMLQTFSSWIGADNARWHASTRILRGAAAKGDPMLGWRLRGTRVLLPRTAHHLQLARGFHRVQKDFDIGMTVRAMAVGAGNHFRLHRMRDGFIDFAAFRKTPYYHTYYRELGIHDRMWACFPLNREAESIAIFDGHRRGRHFTERHAALIEVAWRGMRWFHRRLLLSHGLAGAQAPLSSGQRRLVQELLTGKQEKEIAATLGQSAATTHQYVKAILRHFGVRSRAAFLALWLGSN